MNLDRFPTRDADLTHDLRSFDPDAANAESARQEDEAFEKKREEEVERELPWRCSKHPDAQIRHSYDYIQYVMNGYPSGLPLKHNHSYECAECGQALSPPNENRTADLPLPQLSAGK